MLAAIHFDHELRRRTEEIDDARSDRLLSPEAESFDLLAAQARPQPDLGVMRKLRARLDGISGW